MQVEFLHIEKKGKIVKVSSNAIIRSERAPLQVEIFSIRKDWGQER